VLNRVSHSCTWLSGAAGCSAAHERQQRLRNLVLGGLTAALPPPATLLEARAAPDPALALGAADGGGDAVTGDAYDDGDGGRPAAFQWAAKCSITNKTL